MSDDDLDRLEGASSRATLDHRAQTIVFEHHGATATDEQKAQSPLAIPLGAIEAVECKRGRSTNWFWVVRRGREPWRDGVWSDPCAVVSTTDPADFVERVRAAVARATPVTVDASDEHSVPPRSWRSKLAKGAGRAIIDGFFNTR